MFRFDVFQLDQPMMQYNITVRLLQFNGFTSDPDTETETANWTTVSTFYLNPSRSVSRSKDGRVRNVMIMKPQNYSMHKRYCIYMHTCR